MDATAIDYIRALRDRDNAEFYRRCVTALDGCCPACAAGQPVLYRYISFWGAACHVHTAPAWTPSPVRETAQARSVLL